MVSLSNSIQTIVSFLDVHHKETPNFDELDEKTRNLMVNLIAMNSSYSTQCIENPNPDAKMEHIGNKTECAMLGFLLELGQNYQKIREAHPESSFQKVFTFNSERKSMSIVVKNTFDEHGGYRVFSKGASEMVLRKCKWILGTDGQLRQFGDTEMEQMIKEVVEPMASDGLRTICLAYKDYREGKISMKLLIRLFSRKSCRKE
jgi:magnesium-transporting ATPase (P-type)